MSRTMQKAGSALLAAVPCLGADSAFTGHVTDSPARNRRFVQEAPGSNRRPASEIKDADQCQP